MAWLWIYNDVEYTYDPDGDAITNILLDGIPNDSLIGNIISNGEIMGFATQFLLAQQYPMTFQVQDARGAYSNIVNLTVNVEPADGNRRPICNATINNKTAELNENVAISWAGSYDPDGDALTSVSCKVVDPNGAQEYVSGSSKYWVAMFSNGIGLKFPEKGKYQIWLSVSDSKNAWSNWIIFEVNITNGSYIELELITSPSSSGGTMYSFDIATTLGEKYGPTHDPYDILKKAAYDPSIGQFNTMQYYWTISGRAMNGNGTPKSNTEVTVTLPHMDSDNVKNPPRIIVYTNSSGEFSYICKGADQYWPLFNERSSASNGWKTPTADLGSNSTSFYEYGEIVASISSTVKKATPVYQLVGQQQMRQIGEHWQHMGDWQYIG